MAITQEQKRFIASVGVLARADMLKSRVLASLTIAQAILESAWGTSGLTVKANALFGIKAGKAWGGKVYDAQTKECYDGENMTTVSAAFRAYDSWEESVTDHSAFLTGAARYAAVIGERDYKKACVAIKAAGYATDPAYSDKLIKIIEQYDLNQYNAAKAEGGSKMNIVQDFIPAGRGNRPGRANGLKYITIHNTGNSSKGAGAKSHAAYVKSEAAANAPVSWHYTVDESSVYQHLPDNEIAWHAGDGGSGTGNTQSIGIEICMNSDGNLLGATDNAVELTASLCKKYNIPVENVVQHNRWTGKNCPQMIREGKPYNWDVFIGKVRALLGTNPAPAPQPSENTAAVEVGDIVQFTGGGVFASSNAATATATKGESRCKVTQKYSGKHPYHLVSEDGKGVYGWVDAANVTVSGTSPAPVSYTVKVTADSLNIRKGPGTNYAVNGEIKDQGIYTIVEESSGTGAKKWGKLKSGAGWISLDFTEKR